MSQLAERQCIPCKSGVPPLKGEALTELEVQLDPGWEIVEEHHLSKLYKFRNFADALSYVNAVGAMAEEQGHHPDLGLAWGRVRVEIWTHKIKGLNEADFIFAAKCDTLYPPT